MALRRLAKDAGSSKVGCPAVYVDDEDITQMAVQGPDRGTDGMIQVLPGEAGVRVPAETVIRAATRFLITHPVKSAQVLAVAARRRLVTRA